MPIAFKTTELEIPRGRKRAPIPDYAVKAVEDALKSGKNVEAKSTHAEIHEARLAFQRLRKEREDLTISVSVTKVDTTTSHLLVQVVKVKAEK